ncbi:MAG: mannitol dehydrogenase family protein [Acetobacteraceae bacterium]
MRLSRDVLSTLPHSIYRPHYDVKLLRSGIVHLGCGNFHRAHQAVATQAALNEMGAEGHHWGIASATMRRPDLVTQLAQQDNLYTLLTRERSGTTASVIGSLHKVFCAADRPDRLIERIASPTTKIVTLTITATGYHLSADGQLDVTDPLIRNDFNNPSSVTAVAFLARGLERVRQRGTSPPVIICCDNLSHNGVTLRAAVMAFAEAEGRGALAKWIAGHVQFPDTMVDRIVPTPHEGDIADASRLLGGIDDEIPVSAEPWFQWIIQHFDGPRPFWEAHHGTRFVHDVDMFERAKLQMLNGSHMLLAYVGQLTGRETIAEAASDPVLGPLARRFMRFEQTAGLHLQEKELDDYTDELMSRLKNPAIVHEAERIGRNGSAKMAARVIRPMRENISAGRDVTGAVLLIASWIRWFALHEKEVLEISLEDPRAAMLKKICAECRDHHAAQAEAFLAMEEVFGPSLPDHNKYVADIAEMLKRISEQNMKNVLRATLKDESLAVP